MIDSWIIMFHPGYLVPADNSPSAHFEDIFGCFCSFFELAANC